MKQPVLAIGIGPGKMPPPTPPGRKAPGPSGGPPPPPADDSDGKPVPDQGGDQGADPMAQATDHLQQIASGDPKVFSAFAALFKAICDEEQQEGEYPPSGAMGGDQSGS